MDFDMFCRDLPKVELHAHLNGSLSQSTMLKLKRHHADMGIVDKTNVFLDEFQIAAGDSRTMDDCFQVFGIAHSLTTTPESLAMATTLTLKEFQEDGCCYIELRSTPRQTEYMTMKQYLDTLIGAIKESSCTLTIKSKLIVSINRASSMQVAKEITDLAIEYYKLCPNVVVGIELSGNPAIGRFEEFVPLLEKARKAGLKISLHCGEISNPEEVLQMLKFKPDRIGHGICIHPKYGGTDEAWALLCDTKIPVEICLTSNVNTKSIPDYNSHHFKELYEASIPVVICTDDKGVFATSLSQEYRLCGETFNLTPSQLSKLSLNACQFVFAEHEWKMLNEKIINFMEVNKL